MVRKPSSKLRAVLPVNREVYTQDDFLLAFTLNLNQAKALVIIQSPFVTTRRVHQLLPTLRHCIERGVRVCYFYQTPRADTPKERLMDMQAALNQLVAIGVHVNARPKIHEKIAVIDGTTLWEGSLNILSHFDSRERMSRWVNPREAMMAVRKHNLDSCHQCSSRIGFALTKTANDQQNELMLIGEALANQRRELGLSQAELGAQVGVSRQTIAAIENGRGRDVTLRTIQRVMREVNWSLRVVPWYAVPAVDERFGLGD